MPTPFDQPAIDDPDLLEEQVKSILWKRAPNPSEIAHVAVLLASSEADYVTGSTYITDGGLSRNLGHGASSFRRCAGAGPVLAVDELGVDPVARTR